MLGEEERKYRKDAHFAGQLNAMLHARVRLECFPLDLIQEIRTTTKELAMRELPSLGIS